SAYRRCLRATSRKASEIDPGKVAAAARYDGLFVLRTNARITPLQAVLRYRDLLQVESLFRTAKALMRTRPIYHASDAAIRGHVFCSFLALILRQELDSRCRVAGFRPEWGDVLRDLDRLQKIEVDDGGAALTLRTPGSSVHCSRRPASPRRPTFTKPLPADLRSSTRTARRGAKDRTPVRKPFILKLFSHTGVQVGSGMCLPVIN